MCSSDLAAPGSSAGPEPDWRKPGPDLSQDQQKAATALEAAAREGGFGVTLLDGVPGSGKTEVYFQAVAEALKQIGRAHV